ncbi:30S ribosomal protein S3 [bacterium]|jgi:small subunit ribosomal protein S3|nr:30S ribosomal protein S3 [bacterium]
MGQKAHPNVMRIGIVKDWESTWFADQSNYSTLILEDIKIKSFIEKELKRAGVVRVEVHRKSQHTEIKIHVARPGVVFGKGGKDIKFLAEEVNKLINRKAQITIIEDKDSEISSKMIREWVAMQLEKRNPFRRVMKMTVQKAMKSGAQGVKISCAGRLGGAEIARTEWYREGRVPLHTLRANIDYDYGEANTTFGKIGIKVWIYKGDIIKKTNVKPARKQTDS